PTAETTVQPWQRYRGREPTGGGQGQARNGTRRTKGAGVSRTDRVLVSVMIGVYNCAAYLGEAIDSVLRQSHQPIELIVVDDGSTDGSGAIAKAYGPRVRCIRQERGGMAAARNRAVEDASGKFF